MLNKKRFSVIFMLGMSAGLPLALILSTLKAVLTEKGVNLQVIGLFSLVSLPYSIKFFFAPFIDGLKLPFLTKILGQRKSWIILLQILLALTIFALGGAFFMKNLGLIATLSFLVAFFSASQDVVIDGYRIELFDEKNQGLAASFYIFGYRIGMLLSGALALFLADRIDWSLVFYLMAAAMGLYAFLTCFADETRKDFAAQKLDFIAWLKNYVINPILDFTKKKDWLIILLLIVSFKLSDAFAGSLAMPFFLSLEFTKTQIAAVVKTFGLFATLFGVFCGGFLIKKISIYRALFLAIIIQGVSNLAFAYLAQIGNNIEALYFVIFVENFSGGIGDAVFVAYLSMLCNISFSATQYAILSSFAGLSRALFAGSAGIAAAHLGWHQFFVFSAVLLLPALAFLALINKKNA